MLENQIVDYNDEKITLEIKKIDDVTYDVDSINKEMSHEIGITIAQIYFMNSVFENDECITKTLNEIIKSIAAVMFQKDTNTTQEDNSDISIQALAEDNEKHEKCKITFSYLVDNLYYDLCNITFCTAYDFKAKSTEIIIKKIISTITKVMQEMVRNYKNVTQLTNIATKIEYNKDYNILIKRLKFNNLHYFKISKIHKIENIKTHIFTVMINDINQKNTINAIINTNINLTKKILEALL